MNDNEEVKPAAPATIAEHQISQDLDSDDDTQEPPPLSPRQKFFKRAGAFYEQNEFLILVVIAICLARAYPPLGAKYVQRKYTAEWIAVVFIFILAGLALRSDEFLKAFQQVYFNAFVQLFNFGFISSVVFGFSRFLIKVGALSKTLADGMTICGCLPITVNMCVVLTKAAGGDEAAAIFNTAFANMIGIFITPLLIIGYIGVEGGVNTGRTFAELSLKVLLPLIVGQILQKTSSLVVRFVKKFKKHFLRGQEYALVFILYTTFSKTFAGDKRTKITEIFLMIAFQFCLLVMFTTIAWYSLKLLIPNKPKLRVMGLFGCTHKTIAVGVPLILSIYGESANIGVYTLPLLVWYPMQLIIGTFMLPKLKLFLKSEADRLGIVEDEDVSKSPTFTAGYEVADEEQGDPDAEDEKKEEIEIDARPSDSTGEDLSQNIKK